MLNSLDQSIRSYHRTGHLYITHPRYQLADMQKGKGESCHPVDVCYVMSHVGLVARLDYSLSPVSLAIGGAIKLISIVVPAPCLAT